MKNNRSVCALACIILIVALLCMFGLSCSDKSVTPPGNDNTGLDVAATVTTTVGRDGDVLETTGSDNAIYQIVIPPGALKSDVQVTITPYIKSELADSLGLIGRGIQLKPEGTQFEQPVRMYITLPPGTVGTDPICLYHISDGDSLGVLIPTTIDGQVLSASIDHFSSVLPVAPTEQQLINYFNALSMTIYTYGEVNTLREISALVDGYLFVLANATSYRGINLPILNVNIQDYLITLISAGIINCNGPDCATGVHLLERVESLAIAMQLSTQYSDARDARVDCQGIIVNVNLRFPSGQCTFLLGGEMIPIEVTAFNPQAGTVVSGTPVHLWVSGGGTLAATTGITDVFGKWSTTYTAPTTISSTVEIHVGVSGNCDPNYEVVEYITGMQTISMNGPVFGWGVLPISNTNITGFFRINSYGVGCENDDGCSVGRNIENTCDTGFTALSSLVMGSSCSFLCGGASAQGSFYSNYNAGTAVYSLNWSASSIGLGSGSYGGGAGGAEFKGAIIYQKPGNQPFPAGSTLKVRIAWSGTEPIWRLGNNSSGYNGPSSGMRSFDVPIPEGALYHVLPLQFGSSSGYGQISLTSINVTIECENCGQ